MLENGKDESRSTAAIKGKESTLLTTVSSGTPDALESTHIDAGYLREVVII